MKQVYWHRTTCEEMEMEPQVVDGRVVLVGEDGEYFDRRFWNTGEEIEAEWRALPVEERAYCDFAIGYRFDPSLTPEENWKLRDQAWNRDKEKLIAAYIDG